jgi:hypothetical protein
MEKGPETFVIILKAAGLRRCASQNLCISAESVGEIYL